MKRRHIEFSQMKDSRRPHPRWVRLRPEVPVVPRMTEHSFAAEQYRSIAVQVSEIIPDVAGSGLVLAVTGVDAGCGKTLTSVNLAFTLARGGQRRVLLVEGDLWRPKFHELLEVAPTNPGLFQLLEKSQVLNDVIVSVVSDEGSELDALADVVTAGGASRTGNLVAGQRMAEVLAKMASSYEVVVLDCPPLPLANGRSLALRADGAIIVVGSGQSRKRDIEHALSVLGPEKTVGLVLNRVAQGDLEGLSSYYAYSRYLGPRDGYLEDRESVEDGV